MNYQAELSDGKVVESTQENCDEIMSAIEKIMGGSQSREEVFIALDEAKQKAFICLYAKPLENDYDVLCLKRDLDGMWKPSNLL